MLSFNPLRTVTNAVIELLTPDQRGKLIEKLTEEAVDEDDDYCYLCEGDEGNHYPDCPIRMVQASLEEPVVSAQNHEDSADLSGQ